MSVHPLVIAQVSDCRNMALRRYDLPVWLSPEQLATLCSVIAQLPTVRFASPTPEAGCINVELNYSNAWVECYDNPGKIAAIIRRHCLLAEMARQDFDDLAA